MEKIIGRSKEKLILGQILKSQKAEFLAIYGRRRVGKTFLIREFFAAEACLFFYSSGMQQGSLKDQLKEFAKQIGHTFYSGAPIQPRKNWTDAFDDLNQAIARLPKQKKIVVFLDELPWMATHRSKLLQTIDYYWNRYWSNDSRIKLIVCGSSASWIIEKIINNKGGLYNRVTRTLCLHPFSLSEAFDFLKSQGIKLTHKQVLELYLVFGGIPHYLALIRKGLSAHQAIEELCFQKDGALVKEFDRVFASLFNEATIYTQLIEMMAQHPYGIGQAELLKKIQFSAGGRATQKLKELEEAGFILAFIPHGHKEKGIYYKVIDEFILFYLRWIKPNLNTILKQNQASGFWIAQSQYPSFHAWAGYAFEAICHKHLAQIRHVLHIDPGASVGNWRYAPRTSHEKGAQIDLLFDRNDDAITVCEIKYTDQSFILDKNYSKNLLNKIETYKTQTKTTKQIFLAMITVNGIKPSIYSEEMISGVVILEDLFEF